jgi:CRISPR-associated protein Csm4
MLFLVKLSFKGALAIGGSEFGGSSVLRGTIHSDTLFSGIVNQWVKVPAAYDIDHLISKLNSNSPPFRISSAFPYRGTEYYLPIPRGTDEWYMDISKDVPYLELSDFLELANGNRSRLAKIPLKNPVAEFITGFTSPRVSIDRLANVSNPYQLTGWKMAEGSGLYLLLNIQDETLKDTLELCIRMLGDAGIGSDRNVGYGTFDPEISPISDNSDWTELFLDRTGEEISYCMLSLCCPANNSEAKEAISYGIISRNGWILSNFSFMQMKRRECRMFSEGSLFKSPIKGCVADVTPSVFKQEHNVYRYGLGMMAAGAW